MERSELIQRLVPLIPPPRAHQVRYHGILAPCASWRDRVVPAGEATKPAVARKPAADTDGPIDGSPTADPRNAATGACADAPGAGISSAADEPRLPAPAAAAPGADPRDTAPNRAIRYRHRWADLLQRVFGIDALRCPRCGSTLRLIAAIEDPAVARAILECLKLPARAPPLAPAPRIDDVPGPTAPGEPATRDFDQTPRDKHFELS